MNYLMKKLLIFIVLLAAGYAGLFEYRKSSTEEGTSVERKSEDASARTGRAEASGDAAVARAWERRASGVQLEGHGTVIKVLPDDNDGSRHQRFLLKLRSGATLLIAHNIDLAPRIDALQRGDEVAYFGQYEWNPRGGVIHWTHHDPSGRHVDGWLKHKGQIYQ